MTTRELLRWQWQGYERYHQDRVNLLIHLIAVPLFLAANLLMVAAVVRLSAVMLAVGLIATLLAVALQARGHRRERVPPEPFTGAGNFVHRLLVEQWVTFPRFVLSGGWRGNLAARRPA